MKRLHLAVALLLAALTAGCAEVTKSVNGAGKTVDGWFSPNK